MFVFLLSFFSRLKCIYFYRGLCTGEWFDTVRGGVLKLEWCFVGVTVFGKYLGMNRFVLVSVCVCQNLCFFLTDFTVPVWGSLISVLSLR